MVEPSLFLLRFLCTRRIRICFGSGWALTRVDRRGWFGFRHGSAFISRQCPGSSANVICISSESSASDVWSHPCWCFEIKASSAILLCLPRRWRSKSARRFVDGSLCLFGSGFRIQLASRRSAAWPSSEPSVSLIEASHAISFAHWMPVGTLLRVDWGGSRTQG